MARQRCNAEDCASHLHLLKLCRGLPVQLKFSDATKRSVRTIPGDHTLVAPSQRNGSERISLTSLLRLSQTSLTKYVTRRLGRGHRQIRPDGLSTHFLFSIESRLQSMLGAERFGMDLHSKLVGR